MRTQSLDTTPEFEQVQIARLRSFSPAKKFASARSWTRSLTSANFHAPHPFTEQLSERDRAVHFLTREYGKMFASLLQHATESQPLWTGPDPDVQAALLAAVEACEALGLTYALGGSLACSIYGFPRLAQDVDVYVDISSERLPLLVAHVHQAFLFDEQQLFRDLAQDSCFRLLHLASLLKVDVLLPSCSFEAQALQRRQALQLTEDRPPTWVLRPEDVALLQLVWYHRSGTSADDRWNDVLGLLKVQAPFLDLPYLSESAAGLQATAVLEQGLRDAGIHEASGRI